MVCAVLFNSVDESGLSSMTMVSFELFLIVFKHEGLRSALDQVKQTASDTRKTRYLRTVWLYSRFVNFAPLTRDCNLNHSLSISKLD